MSRSTFTFFILLLSFGILFAGCGAKPEPDKSFEEFTFSDTDLQRVQQLASSAPSTTLSVSGSQVPPSDGMMEPTLSVGGSGTSVLGGEPAAPDKAKRKFYDNLRTGVVDQGGNVYRVNNPFLNVRKGMDVTSALLERLGQGDIVTVLDIPNAEWAKVRLQDQTEGYVAFRYLAKLTTDQKLPDEKKLFEGKYYVDYAFLNIRKDPSTQSEKVGELPGQSIIKPLSMNGEWTRVTFDGKEGYVSTQYLKPLQPTFLIRQDDYAVPVLHYYADDSSSITALPKHIAALKAQGKRIVTLRSVFEIVLAQETRDARVSPDTVVLVVDGVNAKNVRQVSDALQTAGAAATLFIQTKDIGLTGITEKTMLTLLANGDDLQSAGHTGDDFRSMTDSQVLLELGQSKKLIEDLTKKEVYAIAYPKAGVNDRVMNQAADMGFLFGITNIPDKKFSRSQFLRMPTLVVSGSMTADDVVRLLK
jgi:uncharacterized protein YgiM (DUF1202 family)